MIAIRADFFHGKISSVTLQSFMSKNYCCLPIQSLQFYAAFLLPLLLLVSCHEVEKPLAIMQGATGRTQTEIVIAHLKSQPITIYIIEKDSQKKVDFKLQMRATRDHSPWVLENLQIHQLVPQKVYQLLVLDKKTKRLRDKRDFQSLSLEKNRLRFAVVSCMSDNYPKQKQIWSELLAKKPQAVFMIGDNSYVDLGVKDQLFNMTPEKIWDRHMETRNKLHFFKSSFLIPVFALGMIMILGSETVGVKVLLKSQV